MKAQHTTSQKYVAIAIAALAALALVVLFVKLEAFTRLTNILGNADWVALELVPHFVAVAAAHCFFASSLGHLWVSFCPLQMLASCLPLHILLALA